MFFLRKKNKLNGANGKINPKSFPNAKYFYCVKIQKIVAETYNLPQKPYIYTYLCKLKKIGMNEQKVKALIVES